MFTAVPPIPGSDSVRGLSYISGIGLDASGMESNWKSQVENMFGVSREAPAVSITPEREANKSIVYGHTIVPWLDGTHRFIQPGMLVFNSRYVDPRYKLTNTAPIFKVNMELRKCSNNFYFPNPDKPVTQDANRFRQLLQKHGEIGMEWYFNYEQGRFNTFKTSPDFDECRDLYQLALKPEFSGLTKWGILKRWNFTGVVLSKGESTGAGVYLDHHDASDTTYVAGIVHGEAARTLDVWGGLKAGHHCFLILTRVGKHFEWKPYASSSREYPPKHLIYYKDDCEIPCRAHVLYVGLCTEKREHEPSRAQVEGALGYIDFDVEKAYKLNGSLPQVVVQLGI